jgi:hypothetical protein
VVDGGGDSRHSHQALKNTEKPLELRDPASEALLLPRFASRVVDLLTLTVT